MTKQQRIVSIKFDGNNKPYTFDAGELELQSGDKVVVQTVRGLELGNVFSEPKTIEDTNSDYKQVVRLATEYDIMDYHDNLQQAKSDRALVEEAIERERLPMNVVNTEYTLNQNKLIITYVSEKRVDFRNLLKELTSIFPCRIELKQIGHRDKAKMVGGIGVCGRELCCTETLGSFETITISMAKNQMLSLNIGKLSGQCGKLKCCLRFENDYYTDEKSGMPRVNDSVNYKGNQYRVRELNVITHTLTLTKPEEILVITFDDWKVANKEKSVS